MNHHDDLFIPPRFRPRTRSEYLEGYNATAGSYQVMRDLVHGEAEHQAEIYVPNAEHEKILSDIEIDLEDWSSDYSKRRAMEKATAAYIREKVAPRGLMSNAMQIAERLETCRNSGVLGFELGSGRKLVKWKDKCGLVKLCPDEARAEQKRLARRYTPAVEAWLSEKRSRQFQYAVFEPVNVPHGELQEGIRAAYKQFRDLMRHTSMQAVKGCFSALECPMGRDGKSWNVHINALFLVEGHFDWQAVRADYGARIHFYSTQQMLDKTQGYLDRRAEHTGQDIRLDRTQVLLAAFREIIKYSAKHIGSKSESGRVDVPGITEWPPELFVEWYTAHHGLRRCRSYGVLHGVTEPEREPLQVQWIGSIDYTGRGYECIISKRRPIISLQEDKSTRSAARNRRQNDIFRPPKPAGGFQQ